MTMNPKFAKTLSEDIATYPLGVTYTQSFQEHCKSKNIVCKCSPRHLQRYAGTQYGVPFNGHEKSSASAPGCPVFVALGEWRLNSKAWWEIVKLRPSKEETMQKHFHEHEYGLSNRLNGGGGGYA